MGGTTRDQLSIPGKQILIDTHVLVLGENSIVVLETILFQKGGIAKKTTN